MTFAASEAILPRRTDDETWPLSFAQQHLWSLDRERPGNPIYHLPLIVRLRGALEIPALERSLAEVVRRHDALRACFLSSGAPRQQIEAAIAMTLPVTEIDQGSAAARRQQLLESIQEEIASPFTLSTGRVCRARLFRIGKREHFLVLTVHHIAADRASLRLMLEEIASLYASARAETAPRPATQPVQYAAYARWQREWWDSGQPQRLLQYWQQRLDGAPSTPELPLDRPRSGARTGRGASGCVSIPPQIVAAVSDAAREQGTTPFVALLAGLKALLSRYADATDLVVGTSTATRTCHEVQGVIGNFANTLVLRTDLGAAPSYRELLRRLRDTTSGAFAHAELPFDRLVEAMAPRGTWDQGPWCRVMFSLEEAPFDRQVRPDLWMTQIPIDTGLAPVELELRLWNAGDAVEGRFEYDADLFDASTTRHLADHFGRLLAGAAANPDARVADVPLLGRAESRRIVRGWSASTTRFGPAACLDELFAEQVRRTPTRIAAIAGDDRVTYSELASRAHRLARHLIERFAAGPEERVAVCLDRGIDYVVAALAVWISGGVYVPLDPVYPIERLRRALETIEPRVVICDAGMAVRLTDANVSPPLCSLADDAEAIAAEPTVRPRRRTNPRHAAYIIHTSGSTGTPNGVVVAHAALAHYVRAMGAACGITALDRYLHTASFGFSSSIRQMLVPLTQGAAMVIARQAEVTDPTALFEVMDTHGVTIADWVPSHWRQLTDVLKARASSPGRPRPGLTLRLILSASEPLPPDQPSDWQTTVQAPIRTGAINMFGQTETTGIAALYPIPRQMTTAGRFVPIGRPIAGARIYVLDARLHPVPSGVPGDIYVGGPTLARGYWRRPGLTAERFIPDPFGPLGARLYRCGDRGRYRADGTLEFLGRADHQIKIRGHRVELGEIETQLLRHLSIREAAVVTCGEDGARRLAAYIVPSRTAARDVRQWRVFLQERLPAYMVPAHFVVMDALPRTPTNKIDRRALAAVPRDGFPSDSEQSSDTPSAQDGRRTPTEEALTAIWQETLHVDRLSVDDNFFECGGHSLVATLVVSRVRDVFRIELPIRALFDAPTIAALAPIVDALRAR